MNANEMAATALENAADNLLIHGWQRGRLGERGSSMCAVGHINTGMEDALGCADRNAVWADPSLYARWTEMCQTLYRALYATLGIDRISYCNIPEWNDNIAKDEWEVRDAFLTAAKEIRGGGGL